MGHRAKGGRGWEGGGVGEELVYCHLKAFGDLGVFPINAQGWDTVVPISTLALWPWSWIFTV